MTKGSIRNFVIIAHIDHGKSTLADRFLEMTGAVSPHRMKEQYLDQLELERERGITIKMAPVRMPYVLDAVPYILNLIDTPGHSDFSYEVSRSLKAVEGAILLVDATQGIQAQTLAHLGLAKNNGLVVVGALNKVDLNPPGQDALARELADLIGVSPVEIHRISGKTGDGVAGLLRSVIKNVPPPQKREKPAALIFSSLYDDHKGVVAFVRVFGGSFTAGEKTKLQAMNHEFKVKEVGYFAPELTSCEVLDAGTIGYLATGIKNPDLIKIGDTIGPPAGGELLAGFRVPHPVVFVSLYPQENDEHEDMEIALHKLRLSDSSFSIASEASEVLGRGFQCGFLGRLHFEIVSQRLEREFGIKVASSFPSVSYQVRLKDGSWRTIEKPKDFPNDPMEVLEPITLLAIITPPQHLGAILRLKELFHLSDIKTESYGDRVRVFAKLPLADLVLDFDDKLKSVSQGFASFSYEVGDYERVEVERLDVLVAGEPVAGLSRVIHKDKLEFEARYMVGRLKELLPQQQFAQSIQAACGGRIIARENIPALRKDVTGYLYGGDRTRKMKLWKKQKKGKSRLKSRGRVQISAEVFRELLKK